MGTTASAPTPDTRTTTVLRSTLGSLPNENILPTLHNFQERWHALAPGSSGESRYASHVIDVLGKAAQREHERQSGIAHSDSILSSLLSVATLLEGPSASPLERQTVILLLVAATLEGVRLGYA